MLVHLAMLVVVFFAPPADPTKDAAKRDLEKLQGTWVLVGGESDGVPWTETRAKEHELSIVIKGETFTLTRRKDNGTVQVRLDSTKGPAWMDLVGVENKSLVNHAIYKLNGDHLTI